MCSILSTFICFAVTTVVVQLAVAQVYREHIGAYGVALVTVKNIELAVDAGPAAAK
jgi:hypothetical protein